MMHPLRSAVEAAVEASLDFFIVVGGDRQTRLRMGLPPIVVDRQPLLLAFEARYHRNSAPVADDVGLTCELSFDALYHCRIPWATVLQLAVNHPGDGKWPAEWSDGKNEPAVAIAPVPSAEESDTRDNIRPFRPRRRAKDEKP